MLTFQANFAHLQAAASERGGATPVTTPITTPITTQDQLVALIQAKPGITQKDLGKVLGLTRDGIKYHLSKMKQAGKIRHVGPMRGGRWEVLE